MSYGSRFQATSLKLVNKFGNTAKLLEPTSDDFDPASGDTDTQPNKYDIKYLTITDQSNSDTSLKASSFRESVVYFTVVDSLIINETWGIEGLKGVLYDITQLEKIEITDVIVGYYALIKGRVL